MVKARYPDYDWKTEGRVKNYWDYYTLNDGLAGTVADTLIAAHQVYKDEKYRAALEKLGDFLILAQMPDPQPGWCQQYNYEMVPIWARKFEPPAITGWESQDVMETLIKIARYTGEKKYLEPIPRALEYFKKCLLPDGRVARYYEFKTNRPLYMDAKYQLTYDDSAAPSHYGWKQAARFERDREGVPGRQERRRRRRPRGPLGAGAGGERPQDHPGPRRGGAVGHDLRGRAARRPAEVRRRVPLHLQRRLQPQRRDPERVRRTIATMRHAPAGRRAHLSAARA